MKRRELLLAVANGLEAGSAHRQIARSVRCAKTSVTRMAERLGRHAILFHHRCLERLRTPPETLVHDHFESFVGRQDRGLGIGTAVGALSWFVYDLDPAPHRGAGRRPDRRSADSDAATRVSRPYVRSIRRTLRRLLAKRGADAPLDFNVDGRRDYLAAIRDPAIAGRVRLHVYPNPERGPRGTPRCAAARLRDWAMFPNDQLHQMVRHTCAEHKRETLSFGRRIESIVGRMTLFAVWKNFVKARSERAPDRATPAMRVGLADRPWPWERILSRRLFVDRERPTGMQRRLYEKRWTPGWPSFDRSHAA